MNDFSNLVLSIGVVLGFSPTPFQGLIGVRLGKVWQIVRVTCKTMKSAIVFVAMQLWLLVILQGDEHPSQHSKFN